MVSGLRVLVPTSRSWYRIVSAGAILDFENAMAKCADVDFAEVPPLGRRAHLRSLASGSKPRRIGLDGEYDLCFLAVFQPDDIRALAVLDGVRRHCRRVVVYVFDAWAASTVSLRRHRRLWSLCDKVFVSFPAAVDAWRTHIDCPVEYLPQAIDPERFRPRADKPIDVLSVGRRLESVHRQLLDIAARHDLWYQFSESRATTAIDLDDSQFLLARLCRSARIQICWPVEITNPETKRSGYTSADGSPVTARWFEAAASGSIVMGTRPASPEFDRLFPSRAFVRELPRASLHELERELLRALTDDEDLRSREALADHVRTHHSWQARCVEILKGCARPAHPAEGNERALIKGRDRQRVDQGGR
jgi:Glycosyl transferases group 1